jgi:hypothetical protein
MRPFHRLALLLLSATPAFLGCGAAPDPGEEDLPTDTVPGEIRGGAGEGTRQGVVELRFCTTAACKAFTGCTGVPIAKHVILTAGHCVEDFIHSGDLSHVFVEARMKRRGRYMCISGASTNSSGLCSGGHDAIVSSVYRGNHDAASDVAKVSLVLGHADVVDFDLSTLDLAYVYDDTLKPYGRLEGWGYGDNSQSGTGFGTLRSGTFEVDWYGSNHFITINRGAGTCAGDSGGPMMIYANQSGGEPQVVGLVSSHENRLFKDDNCGASGQETRSVRLSAWMSWVQSSGPNYVNCTSIKSPANGRRLWKCF